MPTPAQLTFIKAADNGDEQACLNALVDIDSFDNVSLQRDHYMSSVIHKVAKNGLTLVLDKMLERGFNVTQLDSNNQNALHIALSHGHFAFANRIAEAKPELCQTVDVNGLTPLHLSARYGQDTLVKFCVAQGMDVNAVNWKDQQTPLHFAAIGGHASTIKVLFELGAHARVYNVSNHLPSIVCRAGIRELRQYLRSKEAEVSLLERCALATAALETPVDALPLELVEYKQAIVSRFDAVLKQTSENNRYWESQTPKADALWEAAQLEDATEQLGALKLGQ